uniref:Uncharacterized protein n=1 Tax=Anguilla anguilla TaxID=7936 RepID=A0A0E9UKE0_ANGAN
MGESTECNPGVIHLSTGNRYWSDPLFMLPRRHSHGHSHIIIIMFSGCPYVRFPVIPSDVVIPRVAPANTGASCTSATAADRDRFAQSKQPPFH